MVRRVDLAGCTAAGGVIVAVRGEVAICWDRCSITSVIETLNSSLALNSRVSPIPSAWTWFPCAACVPEPVSASAATSAGSLVARALVDAASQSMPPLPSARGTWSFVAVPLDMDATGSASMLDGVIAWVSEVAAVACASVAVVSRPGTVAVPRGRLAMSEKSLPSSC